MGDRVPETSSWAESFQQQFNTLTPLILNEWPHLDTETLTYTEGNLDLVVDYIAAQTDHTRTLVQHHLQELCSVLQQTTKTPESFDKSETETSESIEKSEVVDDAESQDDLLERALKSLERRADRLISRFEGDLLPEVESDRDREKLNNSLVTVFGVGLVIGIILGGWGRGRR